GARIQSEIASYKRLRTCEIESRLKKVYGPNALVPVSDLDRPFTPSELKQFATHPLVTIGNHTQDHAILTNYSAVDQQAQILAAQDDIREICGRIPVIISYPNGNYSSETTELAQSCGLQLGVSCSGGQDRLPLDLHRAMA